LENNYDNQELDTFPLFKNLSDEAVCDLNGCAVLVSLKLSTNSMQGKKT
jgi:hypothetical protein